MEKRTGRLAWVPMHRKTVDDLNLGHVSVQQQPGASHEIVLCEEVMDEDSRESSWQAIPFRDDSEAKS